MHYEKEALNRRHNLINFLKNFKHNEVENWDYIKEPFKVHRDIFFEDMEYNIKLDFNKMSDDELKSIVYRWHKLWEAIERGSEYGITFRDHTVWNRFLFYIPCKFKDFRKNRSISLLDKESKVLYDIHLNLLDYIIISWNIRKTLKEFKRQKTNKTYQKLFDLVKK